MSLFAPRMKKNGIMIAIFISALLFGSVWSNSVSAVSLSWSTPIQITHGAWEDGSSYMVPDAFMYGENIYAVWMDGRDNHNSDYDLYFSYSMNGGISWQTEKRISTHGRYASDPVVVANNGKVHVFVEEDGTFWYVHSSDKGVSWSERDLYAITGAYVEDYNVAIYGMTLYLVWSEDADFAVDVYDINLLKSTDNGVSWSTPNKVVTIDPSSTHAYIGVSASNNNLFIVSDGGLISSNDGGENWGNLVQELHGRHVSADGKYVHLMKGTAYGYEGYTRSEDFGNTWSNVNTTIKGKIAVADKYVYVVDGSQYFLSINRGSFFTDSGTIPNISPVSPYCTSICLDQSGGAHIIFEEWVTGEDHTEIFYIGSEISGEGDNGGGDKDDGNDIVDEDLSPLVLFGIIGIIVAVVVIFTLVLFRRGKK